MGSILSKLFGGGNHNHGSHSSANLPPSSQNITPGQQSVAFSQPQSIGTKSATPGIQPPVVAKEQTPIPIQVNILEVEVDQEAFKETTPAVFTSTIKAQIDPSPPHPLELQLQSAPIATVDSDYEDESAATQETAEIEEAVIKIQAGVRGFLVRKQIHVTKGGSPPSPIKSKSLDDSTTMASQSQDNILPPPKSFDTTKQQSSLLLSSLIAIKPKRIETPIPGSPPFAQDDTNYSILDSVDTPTETKPLNDPQELEIFKKINEINQILASHDNEEIKIVPEPPKSPVTNLQSTPMALSSTSINNALQELDQTIQEQEQSLHPEPENEVILIESAFGESQMPELIPATPLSPSVLIKAPSLEQPDLDDELDQPLLSEVAAAIRIQAAFRGYEVRKSMSREMSPAPESSLKEPEINEKEEEEAQPELISLDTEQIAPEVEIVQESLIPLTEIIQDLPAQEPLLSEPETNVAIKDGFGTIAISAQAKKEENEILVSLQPEPDSVEQKPLAVDIEKSIQELETQKSFDRDLLSEDSIEPKAESEIGSAEATAAISIEPATPDLATAPLVQPTLISVHEPPPPAAAPSRIPILDRSVSVTSAKSILKEPSSPEPHTYSNLALPSCVSPLSESSTQDGDDSDEDDSQHTSSPIPNRASSPSPFSKKQRHRRNRNKKK